MFEKPHYIVSDVHLGAVPDATEHAFRAFLRHVRETAGALLLNGDLFDFWFEYRTVVPHAHFHVLRELAAITDAGIPITLVGGNHDAWGGSFLRREVGMELADGPLRMDIAGRKALVVHGDGVGAGDRGYRLLRGILRSRAAIRGFRAIHPDLGARIARAVSSTESKTGQLVDDVRGRAAHVQRWGEEQLSADTGLDLVVAGHVHVPACVEVFPGRFYLNAGDWINHFTYLSVPHSGEPRLERWKVATPGST
jgi:UDP-2,3-diacylglucosamine hydrolase